MCKKENKKEYLETKAICPKCHKHYSHRNKQRCPNCGVFLAWPGERFILWEKGYFWTDREYKWREIKELKEWLLAHTLKDDLEHEGVIRFDGDTYFWRDTL